VVRQEQLVWMTGDRSSAHHERPIPWPCCRRETSIATMPSRASRRPPALAHRLRQRKRRGLQAAAFAGMAVTVLGRSALVSRMREIGPQEGLPALPKVDLLLYKSPGATSKAANALHDYLAHYLNLEDDLLEGTDLPFQQQQDNRPRFYD